MSFKRLFRAPKSSSPVIPCHDPPRPAFSIVEIGEASIKTNVTNTVSEIDLVVKTFLSNENNKKKIIGLNTEQATSYSRSSKTALLELCDGDHCLIVQLFPYDLCLPRSLFNFLNLHEFTFVGIDIKKTLEKLGREWGLTCKNAVDIGPSTWNLAKKTDHEKGRIQKLFFMEKPTSPVFSYWSNSVLDENQIKLATSHAYVPFGIGNVLLHDFGIYRL